MNTRIDAQWQLTENGIRRDGKTSFTEHIEMAGHKLAAIVTYGKTETGDLLLSRELCYPQLRVIPRDTHATLHTYHPDNHTPTFTIDGVPITEQSIEFSFDGVLTIITTDAARRIRITRCCFPCVKEAAYIETMQVENVADKPFTLEVQSVHTVDYKRGATGVYVAQADCSEHTIVLAPGEAYSTQVTYTARLHLDAVPVLDGQAELLARRAFAHELMDSSLNLECPDQELCQFFRFAKLRAAESIFDTLSGPLHSPGGGPYYAAIWANDQAEYAGPFFPFMHYDRANVAGYNAYYLFSRFMAPNGTAIPSSIIDEGQDIWEGRGDRGDAAMYLYGCSRYLLAMGNRELAEKLFWTLCWTAEYTLNKKTVEGVIASDTDELEERLPSGDANLCTSSLAYGGLLSAAALAEELGELSRAQQWREEAAALKQAIENYFGATVSGYDTYRYYDGNTQLRSWICIPLTMGIFDRQKGCVDALLSDLLFCDDGMLSVEGDTTIWDRSTLYAFRGILNAGAQDRVYPYMQRYVTQRLLGPHVPYAVEAYPEGDQRHLSAESALFARVVTEGLCGITPVGLHKIELRPAVPQMLGYVTLRNLWVGGRSFDLTVTRLPSGHRITVQIDQRMVTEEIAMGESFVLDIK